MNEQIPKYQGLPKGGAGLGQGRKSTKEYVKKTFALDIKVVDILSDYSVEKGMKKGTTIEFVELAILELHRQMQEQLERPGIDKDTYFDFQDRKSKLFTTVADYNNKSQEQFL